MVAGLKKSGKLWPILLIECKVWCNKKSIKFKKRHFWGKFYLIKSHLIWPFFVTFYRGILWKNIIIQAKWTTFIVGFQLMPTFNIRSCSFSLYWNSNGSGRDKSSTRACITLVRHLKIGNFYRECRKITLW